MFSYVFICVKHLCWWSFIVLRGFYTRAFHFMYYSGEYANKISQLCLKAPNKFVAEHLE